MTLPATIEYLVLILNAGQAGQHVRQKRFLRLVMEEEDGEIGGLYKEEKMWEWRGRWSGIRGYKNHLAVLIFNLNKTISRPQFHALRVFAGKISQFCVISCVLAGI